MVDGKFCFESNTLRIIIGDPLITTVCVRYLSETIPLTRPMISHLFFTELKTKWMSLNRWQSYGSNDKNLIIANYSGLICILSAKAGSTMQTSNCILWCITQRKRSTIQWYAENQFFTWCTWTVWFDFFFSLNKMLFIEVKTEQTLWQPIIYASIYVQLLLKWCHISGSFI